jgi:hypothetical protein
MKTATKVALAALMGCGALLLVLGIVIWTGNGGQLISAHIVFGVVLVLSLWTIAAIAARTGVASGTVALAAAWGLLVVIFGLAQEELLPGTWHWTIQVLHLLISMGAIWWGRRLVRLSAMAQRPAETPSPVAGPRVTTSGTRST